MIETLATIVYILSWVLFLIAVGAVYKYVFPKDKSTKL